MADTRKILRLERNGDPFGKGFVGTLFDSPDAEFGVYQGQLGAQSRQYWRTVAARNGYKLVEVR